MCGLIEQGQFTKWYDEQVEKYRTDDVANTLRIDVCLQLEADSTDVGSEGGSLFAFQ